LVHLLCGSPVILTLPMHSFAAFAYQVVKGMLNLITKRRALAALYTINVYFLFVTGAKRRLGYVATQIGHHI